MDRFVRSGAAVAGLVAALALTACGSDDDSGSEPAAGSGAGQSATPGGDADSGSAGVDAAALDGTWTGATDGRAVVLSVSSGKVALVADQHVCQGDVKNTGEVMLALTCADGNTDRTMGAIESNDGKKLVVSWDGGAEDTLTRTDPGKLPTGLPEIPAP
ncbi:hypothetical protein ACFWVP_20520 [Streptomyces sp. NPDC058637]|uniref:hypothetical protein n=1 Tax=Streptomyces sp. NPDC058637 TaxID=3346569 RepID=UPI0036677B89